MSGAQIMAECPVMGGACDCYGLGVLRLDPQPVPT